ncbi:MAG: universal stress protein [Candidatus Bathyarchaeota archaeon]|nr:universal stress protein [Candidatus Bathyarchaeum sp.]
MVKKILVALDGSKASNNALSFALELADNISADVELLTVVPPVFLPSYSIYVLKSDAISECAKNLEISFRGVLSKAQEEVRQRKYKTKVTTRFEKGEPSEKIVEVANQGGFDLIIIGSRGLGGRVSALGSVSSRVVDKSNCPVLIVK